MALKRAVCCVGVRYGTYKKCSKCPLPAFTHALSRFLNWRIAFSMFSCARQTRLTAVRQPILSCLLALESSIGTSPASLPKHGNQVDSSLASWVPLILLNEIWTIVLNPFLSLS